MKSAARPLLPLVAVVLGFSPGALPAEDAAIPEFRPVPAPDSALDSPATGMIDLRLVSEKKNEITDDEAWWSANGLDSPFLEIPNPLLNQPGQLPPVMPGRLEDGRRVVTASLEGDRPFAIYGADFAQGDRVLVFDAELQRVTHALDFSAWISGRFRIQWVQVIEGTIYASYGINGYAREVEGETGYLAAWNLDTLALAWRSEPLVANSRQFLVIRDTVVSGYGFTAEPDFVHLLNRHDGRIVRSIEVASAPEFLIREGDRLFVRCYNRDYVYDLLDLD